MYKVKHYTGEVKDFATLFDAVYYIGDAVLRFKGAFEGMRYCWAGRPHCINDSHRVHDELGLIVPVETLKYVYETQVVPYLNNRYYGYRSWRKMHRRPEHFRRMPVPYTHCYRGGNGYFRGPQTTQEHRANAALEVDDEALEYGIRPRRRANALPSDRDDIMRCPQHNWKRQRRTQWR